MASYNELDGVPSHANKWLLQDVLRKNGLQRLHRLRLLCDLGIGYRPDTTAISWPRTRRIVRLAVQAGVNIELLIRIAICISSTRPQARAQESSSMSLLPPSVLEFEMGS